MTTILVNAGSAASLLLASTILRLRPGHEVEVTESTDLDSLLEELKLVYPEARDYARVNNSQALILLDEAYVNEHGDGLALTASILGLHYDITDFATQNTLKEVLLGENTTLPEVIAEGKLLLKAAQSPSFKKVLGKLGKKAGKLDEPDSTGALPNPGDGVELRTDDQKTAAVNDLIQDASSSSSEADLKGTIENATNQIDQSAPHNELSTADVNPEIKDKQEHSTFSFEGVPVEIPEDEKGSERPFNEQSPLDSNGATAASLDNAGPVAKDDSQPERNAQSDPATHDEHPGDLVEPDGPVDESGKPVETVEEKPAPAAKKKNSNK